METYDLRIDDRFASEEEIERLIPLLREKNVDVSRPIRHWTIDYARAVHDEQTIAPEAGRKL